MAVRFCEKCKFIVKLPHDCHCHYHDEKLYQWIVTEDFQDFNPYVSWGWDGFVPFIHYGI